MRLAVPALLLLALAGPVACGGDSETGPTACEVGPELYDEALSKLVASSPACSRDDDCVLIQTNLYCSSFGIGLCGTVVHKAVANDWDAQAICQQLDQSSRPGELYCETQASCAAVRAVCVAKACTSADR